MPGHDDEVLVPLAEVQAMVLTHVSALEAAEIPLDDALGCVTSQDVLVAEDVPPFANTAMDGYALRAADTALAPVDLDVVGVLAAGAAPTLPVGQGEAIQIMTGAPIPQGADAIAIVERTEILELAGDKRTPLRVRVGYSVSPGENLRYPGSDLPAGSVAIAAGTVLSPAHLGVLASVGVTTVPAHRRPRVAVMTTGDELVEIGTTPIGRLAPGQIRDSNRHALLATVRRDGFEAVDCGVVRDTEEAVRAAVRQAVENCDAVLTTGGVSKGAFDYVRVVLEQMVGAAGGGARYEQVSVAIRPAKPFAFAVLPRRDRSGAPSGDVEPTVPVFGLPGNPVSSLVSYQVIALPALRVLAGYASLLPRTVPAVAAEAFRRRRDGKLHLNRVQVSWSPDGRLEARSAGGQMSHQLSGMAGANALALLPDGDGVAVGQRVEVLLFGEID